MLAALVVSALLSQAASPELTVYVFTTTDCPISNRYAPEIQRLAAKFKSKVHFVLVYPVPGDSPEMIAEHKKKFAFAMDSVRDADLKLMKLTGATVTPEVAVMNGSLLLYRGRIDDRYIELGKDRPAPTQRDLEVALDAAVTGKPIAVKRTQAIGCILADLVK
jgi:thiol-disulfide isomerase/thioredoxin